MTRVETVRAHVEALCREYLGVEQLVVDGDGDIPVRSGNTLYYVAVIDGDVPLVRVYTHLLRGVDETPELLSRLNDVNRGIVSARVFWHERSVIGATEIVAESMDRDELEHACWTVEALRDWAEDLESRFGGRRRE